MAFRPGSSSSYALASSYIDAPLSEFPLRDFPRAERHQESSGAASLSARRVRFNDAKETEASIHGYSSLLLPEPFTSRRRLSLIREGFDYKEEPMGEQAKNPNVGLTPLVALSPYRHHDGEVWVFRVCVRRQPQELSRRVNDAAKETKASTHGNSTLYQMVAEEATNNALWPSTAKIIRALYDLICDPYSLRRYSHFDSNELLRTERGSIQDQLQDLDYVDIYRNTTPNTILDNTLREYRIEPLPSGARLTTSLETCHSDPTATSSCTTITPIPPSACPIPSARMRLTKMGFFPAVTTKGTCSTGSSAALRGHSTGRSRLLL
jgi:hypothetical protein